MDAIDLCKEIPSWLNQDLFDAAIRSYKADPQAKVNSFDIKPATPPGQNFGSAVFRVKIKYTSKYQEDEKEMSVIIKTLPAVHNIPNMEWLDDPNLCTGEINAYNNYLMKIQELVTSAGYEDQMCPKLIYNTMTPKPVLMLEDISVIGFNKIIQTAFDDFEVSKNIVRRLAKFHAASFYLQDEKQIDADAFNLCMFDMESVEKMFDESLDVLISLLTKWEEYERFIEPVKKFRKTYFKNARKCYIPNAGSRAFNVLNHGDYHGKNVLYKLKSDGVTFDDYMMLDFQTCCYASPAIDLTYALYNFVSNKNRLTHYDELLATYHEQFVEAIKKFGYLKQPPSLLDLQVEMMKNGLMEPIMYFIIFPLVSVDISKMSNGDFDNGLSTMKTVGFENAIFKDILKEYLTRFVNKGFLEN